MQRFQKAQHRLALVPVYVGAELKYLLAPCFAQLRVLCQHLVKLLLQPVHVPLGHLAIVHRDGEALAFHSCAGNVLQ